MPGIGGFEVAEKLASKLSKDETLLIFCTNYDSMVYKSFDYQPFHFVRKNKLDSQLPIVLKKAFDKISRDSQVYTFNSKENEIIINGKEIIYFEIYDKKIKIITTKKSYYINGSLNQIEEKVNEINFMRIHKSYIVNCDFIKNINSKGVNIYGKEGEQITLPIARGKTKIIKQKFHNFAILAGGKK
jgi:DNA-binding LytR/AlgR family response regulator